MIVFTADKDKKYDDNGDDAGSCTSCPESKDENDVEDVDMYKSCIKFLESSCSCCSSKGCNRFFWVIKPILVLILVAYIASDILLYFFLPIDTAFDDATNHFISIYQTAVIFFTAVVAYFLINKPFESPLTIFTQAEREKHIMFLKKKETFTKSNKDNDIIMAAEFLEVLKLQKDYYTKQLAETANPPFIMETLT